MTASLGNLYTIDDRLVSGTSLVKWALEIRHYDVIHRKCTGNGPNIKEVYAN